MAKIQFGSGVAAISGRTAGTVFARNKGGAYMRRFSVPTNKKSSAQLAARSIIAGISSAWKLLDQTARDAWQAWAATHPVIDRLGASMMLTGHQAFVQLNANGMHYGGDAYVQFNTPPEDPTFRTPVLLDVDSMHIDSISLNAGVDLIEDDQVAIWATPPISAGRSGAPSQMRLVKVVTVDSGGIAAGAPLPDIYDEYETVFGDLATCAGKKIVFQGFSYSNGQISTASEVSGLVEAGT